MILKYSKIINILLSILLIVWQLPQFILGIIFLAIFRNVKKYTNEYNGVTVFNICSGNLFGRACFSSGMFIVTCKDCGEETLKHETGHSVQSLYLGPIFHIVVSIPSIIRFWVRKIFKKSKEWYYSGYPENWANKLGGVK